MVLINFEILKLKKTLKLEIPLNSTFSEISTLILENLKIDPDSFHDGKKIQLKFIFDQKVCNGSKTVESLKIPPESKISVFLPKIIFDKILNETKSEQTTDSQPPVKTEAISDSKDSQKSNEKQNISSAEKEIFQPPTNSIQPPTQTEIISDSKNSQKSAENEFIQFPINSIQPPNQTEIISDSKDSQNSINEMQQPDLLGFQPSSNFQADQILMGQELLLPTNIIQASPFSDQLNTYIQPNLAEADSNAASTFLQEPILISSPPQAYYNEANYHTLVLNSVHPLLLKNLTDLNFDPIDSAYALCYKLSPEFAIELILSGVASDPKFRYHINMFIGGGLTNPDDKLQHEIELAKFDAKVKNENEMVAIAAAINRHMKNSPIYDKLYEQKLVAYLSKVESMFPGKLAEKEREDFEMLNYIQNQNVEDSQLNEVNNEFLNILNGYPNMTPDNFVNPYVLLYDDFMELKLADEPKSIIEYGKTLNYEQIGFVYKLMKSNKVELNEVIQILKLYDGDIVSAEQFIELNHN